MLPARDPRTTRLTLDSRIPYAPDPLADRSRVQRRRFYLLCLPTRLLVATAALVISATVHVRALTILMGAAGAALAAGVCVAAIVGRDRSCAGGHLWWANYRVVHAALWSTFASLMIATGSPWASVPLFVDVALTLCFALLRPNHS